MSKAILVMGMPIRCLNCDCVGHINHNGKFNVCRISGDILKEDDYYKKRPDNCPLREVPEKKQIEHVEEDYDGGYSHGFTQGYNACIDEILKGAEENG